MPQSTQHFTVPDMDCQGCVSSITKAVKTLDANAAIAANLATKQVAISSSAASQAIAHAIESAGFTVQAA